MNIPPSVQAQPLAEGRNYCGKPKDFEYGEHPADVKVIAYGCSLEEAFNNGAVGLMSLVYRVEDVEPLEELRVEITGVDLEQLLFNWIDEVLYRFDAEGFAYRRAELNISSSGEEYVLRGKIVGEKYNIRKHGFKGLVLKAMTYHEMEIKRVEDYWVVQFVVDI